MHKEKIDPGGLWVGCSALSELPNIGLLMSNEPIDGTYPRCPPPRVFRPKTRNAMIAYLHEFDAIYDAGIGDSIMEMIRDMSDTEFNALYFALLSDHEEVVSILEPKGDEPYVRIRRNKVAVRYAVLFYVILYMISKYPMTVVQRSMIASTRSWFNKYTLYLEGVFKRTFLVNAENLA